jgi:hypothetical protein
VAENRFYLEGVRQVEKTYLPKDFGKLATIKTVKQQ